MKARKIITTVLMVCGVLLLAVSLIAMLCQPIKRRSVTKQYEEVAAELMQLMPTPHPWQSDDRVNTQMASMQLQGEDYVGTLSVPSLGVTLPIGTIWNEKTAARYPCCYDGSVYEAKFMIGTGDNWGQFDFLSNLNIGSELMVTDMTGAQLQYGVTYCEMVNTLPALESVQQEAELIIFTKDSFHNDFLVVYASRL